nr:MAG TPA: hypothetical protein [Caudoviricetes sp.]
MCELFSCLNCFALLRLMSSICDISSNSKPRGYQQKVKKSDLTSQIFLF